MAKQVRLSHSNPVLVDKSFIIARSHHKIIHNLSYVYTRYGTEQSKIYVSLMSVEINIYVNGSQWEKTRERVRVEM